MNRSTVIRLAIVFVISALAAGPAGAGQTTIGQTTMPTTPAAVFAGGSITQQQVDQEAGAAIERLRNQIYQVRLRTLKRLLFNTLLAEEAKEEGTTTAALLKKNVTDKIAKPDPKRVDALLKRYRKRLGKDEKKARAEIVTALQRQEEARVRQAYEKELFAKHGVRILLNPPRINVPVTAGDPVRGPENAPVTIVEFTDFQCPYCARVQPVLTKLLKKYPGKIRLVYKNTPLSFHSHAKAAAEAAMCAAKQGKFWQVYDWLYAHQAELNKDWVSEAVAATGLDRKALDACIASHKEFSKIDQDLKLSHELGVNATPTFFINGQMVRGAQPFESFDEIVRRELAHKTGKRVQP